MTTSTTIRPSFVARPLATLLFFLSFTALLPAQQAGTSPVRIFILAGQSNMLGHGEMSPATSAGTLEHLVANDPGADYQFLVGNGGTWTMRDDVWIRDQNGKAGGLTAGYGSSATTVGPELGFGHHMGDLYEKQVLIVKAAWGGKSLAVDFRPPSSGGTTGFYYNETLRLVNEATANLKTYFPDYDESGGFEISGFGWHQGWNDRVTPSYSAEYEFNMANFIRDIRNDLEVPGLPFVIATTGMDGGAVYTAVELAQLAMLDATKYSEFVGNVAVIDTRSTYDGLDFWQPVELSPANQGFHWNRNAKTYLHIGLAMGDAMSMLSPGRCPSRLRAAGALAGGVTLAWQNGSETPTSVQVLRDSAQITAAAPVSPATFLDATAQPGVLEYELVFTMPGDSCPPLAVTFDGGITDLEAFRSPGGVSLIWTNNMAYDAVELRRDGLILEPALSGSAESFTDTSPPTGGMVSYSVVPTNGSAAPSEVQISLDGPPPGSAAIHEPFDYETGTINGRDGGIGFAGPWSKTRNDPAIAPLSKTWGSLPTTGNHVRGNAWSGLVRPIGSTLANAGLLENGATLWFSVVFDLEGQNFSNADLNLALGTDYFVTDVFGDRENLVAGEGLGVTHSGGTIQAVYWQDNDADGIAERVENNSSTKLTTADFRALVVGKIEWGADDLASETLTLYTPDATLELATPAMAAWTIPALDQSLFDSLALQFKDTSIMDEIRFGAAYEDVIGAVTPDDDYAVWAAGFPSADLSDPDADLDGDGLTNNEERIWGLDPTTGASANPISVPFDAATGTLTYTRRNPALGTGTGYRHQWTTTLAPDSWDPFIPASEVADGASPVESVTITLPTGLLDEPGLFVRIVAEAQTP